MNSDSATPSAPPPAEPLTPIPFVRQMSEMHQRVRKLDWAATPLGQMDSWPQSLRTVVSTALDCGLPMIVLWGPQLVQIYNDGYRELMGVKHPSGLGQPSQVCWPEVWHLNAPIYARVWQGEPVTLEDRLYPITRQGILVEAFFTLCYSPLRDEAGAIAGVLVTLSETTGHVRAAAEREAALQRALDENRKAALARRAAEERLQLALDAANLGTFVWYPTEDRSESDARMLALFGLPSDSTLSLTLALASLIHRDDRARYAAAVFEALDPAGSGHLHEDIRVVLPDGSERWLALTGQTIFADGPARQPLHLSGVAADITARKRREGHLALLADIDNLFAQHSTADAIMDTVGARIGAYLGITTCTFVDVDDSGDAATVSYAWNSPDVPSTKGTYRLSEYLNEEFGRAHRAGEMVVVRDTQTDPRTDGSSYAAFDIAAFVTVPYLRNGRWTNHLGVSDARPRAWRDDELALIVELANRIFPRLERARAEDALRKSEASLQRLYAQEQAARAQAEEASRLKDEFLATVSHELRTPLTSLLGYAELLQRRKRDEAYVARTAEKILQSAKAQAELIEDLLDISRIVSGKLRIEPQPIQLIDVVQAALDTVRPMVEARGLQLQVELDPAGSAVWGDASRLQQVVWNLLSNAAKFTPPGGGIVLQLAQIDDHAELHVSDTGQGIPPSFLPYVFDRFRQADSSSQRVHSGLGLGLAIVRHLVELHGGTVSALSAGEGQGATFTVRLPLSTVAQEVSQELSQMESVESNEKTLRLRGRRVLVVDDQPAILDLLTDILTADGALVQVCTSAVEALALVRSWKADVLVSDIAMPGQDGYWLIEQVRQLTPEDGSGIPAIALTAYVRMEDRIRVLSAGFQQYLAKPVNAVELVDVIVGLVARGSDF